MDQGLHLNYLILYSSQWQSIWSVCSWKRSKARGPSFPFPFILGSEVFSKLLLQEERSGNIKGLQIARNSPTINHLLFANDLLIFRKATLLEASSIKTCLDKYCSWLGQTFNASKSSIRFSKNTNPTTSTFILNILPSNPHPTSSISLGLPILMGSSKVAAFQNIMDSIQHKMEGWRAKTLSQAGRLVLIKTVAAAVLSYAMSTFFLPKGIYRKLDQVFKNFWWGFPFKKVRNLYLKSWNSLCSPKAFGGLGFRKMEEVNLGLISKLAWKLLTQSESMWMAQLQGKYLSSGSFLSPHSSHLWLCKGILSSQPIISKCACHRFHKKSYIPIWNSPWVPSIPSFSHSPSFLSFIHSFDMMVSDMMVSDLINQNATWNIPLISSLFDSQSVREIQKIVINSSPGSDFLWTSSPSGKFSSSSAYRLISSQSVSTYSSPLEPRHWKLLWKLNLNARLKLFLWKIAWDILPTKARLKAVFPIAPADPLCPFCNMAEDSLIHLFFSCSFARIAWRTSF